MAKERTAGAGCIFQKRSETNRRNHATDRCINHVYPVEKAGNSILVSREINYE